MKSLCLIFALTTLTAVSGYSVVSSNNARGAEQAQPVSVQVEEETYDYVDQGRSLSVAEAEEQDREAFMKMLDLILWNASEEKVVGEGRGFPGEEGHEPTRLFRRQGLLHMQKPTALDDENNFFARMYSEAADTCYALACQWHLGGLAKAILDMFEEK